MHFNRGNAFYNLGRYEEALACYDQSYEHSLAVSSTTPDPENNDLVVNILKHKGFALYQRMRYEESIACINYALELDELDGVLWLSKGNNLYCLKQFEEALKCYDQAEKLISDQVDLFKVKGDTYKRLKRLKDAEMFYSKAIQMDTGDVFLWMNYGEVLMRLDKFVESLDCIEKALKIDTEFNTRALLLKGNALILLSKYDEASIAFERILEISSKDVYGLCFRGLVYDYKGQIDKALGVYKKAKEINLTKVESWVRKEVKTLESHKKKCSLLKDIPVERVLTNPMVKRNSNTNVRLPRTKSQMEEEESEMEPEKTRTAKCSIVVRNLPSRNTKSEEGTGLESRMKIEAPDVGGTGSPLFIFPKDYPLPDIDIHEAAALVMEENWGPEMQKLFEYNIQEHFTKTQRVIRAVQKYDLTDNEAMAIIYYTVYARKDQHNLYLILNTQLAKRSIPDPWRPYLFYLIEGLKKLPSYQGTTYRGLTGRLTQLSEQYKQGNPVVWVAFTSTCKNRDIMLDFAKGHNGTWMRLHINEGKDISEFSLKSNEGEVLLLPNSYFVVKSILDDATKELAGIPEGVDAILLDQTETPAIMKSMVDFC
uniref:NAD(P)(+)--arginine ADP-ribosyltransferase n=1 Tax=Arcella intermedia TaxID=1963864 RepID=A0A6B2L0A4_9EUKA